MKSENKHESIRSAWMIPQETIKREMGETIGEHIKSLYKHKIRKMPVNTVTGEPYIPEYYSPNSAIGEDKTDDRQASREELLKLELSVRLYLQGKIEHYYGLQRMKGVEVYD